VIDTSVVDAGVELDDYGAAPDGLEEVRRRLHRAAAAGLVRAAGAHLSSWCARRNCEGSVGLGAGPRSGFCLKSLGLPSYLLYI